jgi:hypothetical protein
MLGGVPLEDDEWLKTAKLSPLYRIELGTRRLSAGYGNGEWQLYRVPDDVARLLTDRKWTRDPQRSGETDLVNLTALDAGTIGREFADTADVIETIAYVAEDGVTDVKAIVAELVGTSDTSVVAPFLGWPSNTTSDYQVGFYHWAAKAPEPCWLLFTFQGCTD